MHKDGLFVSRFQFVAVFRKCLRAAGFEDKQFASHSFRIGAATEAARCGLGEAAVRKIGRWSLEDSAPMCVCICWLSKGRCSVKLEVTKGGCAFSVN